MSILRARENDLQIWGQGSSRARYDYVTDTYLMGDMLNNDFFGLCWALLKKGDHIYMSDAEDQTIVLRVDDIDKVAKKVYLSKLERLYAMPVVEPREGVKNDPGLIYRWRPVRAGGHSIITAAGEVFAINFPTKIEAERAIANAYEQNVFEAPNGHAPTDQFVSRNVKIYRSA